ncbi:MAG TPA: hypothetical protein VH643_40060 [Gemmataceae bacterium]|jgi:hypothetical protein
MGAIPLRWPVLCSLLFALLGGFIMVYGLAVDNAESSRGGLAVVVSLAPLPLLLRAWLNTFLSPVGAGSGNDAVKADGVSPINVAWFSVLLGLAFAVHAVSSFWLWRWAGDPLYGILVAVADGGVALLLLLLAVYVVCLSGRIQGAKGEGVEPTPNKAEQDASADIGGHDA